jgi:alpha-N-acetylglucosaminidase
MRLLQYLVLPVAAWVFVMKAQAQPVSSSQTSAARDLIRRLIPARASGFVVERLDADSARDVFEVESRDGKIVLRGNTGVAVASALYYYLTEFAHCQVTWNGSNLHLPAPLPPVPARVRRTSPYPLRYYLNYCTFDYSMAWWNWDRWEKEIDWMALHGINMPLAITGEEATWRKVYRSMGFTDAELSSFFAGPAYLAWGWMGNLDGWGGPLSDSWITGHEALEQKILARERALGMKPVLPAFTGHVPAAFATRFPQAKLLRTNWRNGFGDTYILDARDPLFAEVGRRFLQEQAGLYGTDHLYSADTFNENEPASGDSASLASLSARVYDGMRAADPDAIWVMQGWLFYSDRKFWTAPRISALLGSVPQDRMILLDLAAEIAPVWKRTQAFYGKPWIWNMLNNFGGNVNLFGRMEGVASGPALALAARRAEPPDSASGRMVGIGLTMEAIAQNPVMYELMLQHTWQRTAIDLDRWLPAYTRNRYGTANVYADSAWSVLRRTVYNGEKTRDGAESIVTGRPTLDSEAVWTRTTLNYAPADLLPAWDFLVKAAAVCGSSEGFRFDLVDVTRQVLANYALPLQQRWVEAYRARDRVAFDTGSARFLRLIGDMDTLLRTRADFLLGPWLADARAWGKTPAEKKLFEQNARDLLTLWGDASSPLHEYANRQWSGLLNDFYKVRWALFFQALDTDLRTGVPANLPALDKALGTWEWGWVTGGEGHFAVQPEGDPTRTALALYRKYRAQIGDAYTQKSKQP